MLSCKKHLHIELLKTFPTVQETGQSEQYLESYALGQFHTACQLGTYIPMHSPLRHALEGTEVREEDLDSEVTGSNPSSGQTAPSPILNTFQAV